MTAIDPRQYFEQAIRWAEQYFGVPVLSCVQHVDKGSPHAHALPLVGGCIGGAELHGGKASIEPRRGAEILLDKAKAGK